ncbi:MAG: two-component system, OmpR family, sensor histidine kinase MprB [Solirubrobacteraceae bacterium]
MALRGRLTLMSALIVGVVLVLAAVVAYAAVRGQLRGQVDDALRGNASFYQRVAGRFSGGPQPQRGEAPPPSLGGPGGYAQVVRPNGAAIELGPLGGLTLPVTRESLAAATGQSGGGFSDVHVEGIHLRVLTAPLGDIGAVQVARPLDDADRVLDRLRVVLVVLVLLGTALAALASRLFSRRAIAPVTELTEAAEHIEATGDLGRRVDSAGDDEVGRMAARFNAMLARLQTSQSQQRQLVADASHELRTPVTSLRTNVEVLRDSPPMSEPDRRALLDDVVEQAEELGNLVGDLISLARDGEAPPETEDVRIDELVAEAVVRARRHAPQASFSLLAEPSVVSGAPDRLGRAVNNLLDNAAQHSDRVEVRVAANGTVSVRDHGPGIPESDREHLFDRFYRGATARGRPGSGLGLAIVRQVAESHGGSVRVESPEDGGARFVLSLPGSPA